MNLICPYCHNPLAVADNWSGILVCPRCNGRVSVQPTAPPSGPAAAPPPGHAGPPLGGAAPPVGQVVPPSPPGAVPQGSLVQPSASHAATQSGAPRTYRRKSNDAAMTVAILSVVGILMVGGVMLAFAFMPKKESVSREAAGSNQPGGTVSTPLAEEPATGSTRGAAKTSAPVTPRDQPVVRRIISTGLGRATRELGTAMRSWRNGDSYETFLESDTQIAKIELPEWQDRRYLLEKSHIRSLPSASEEERQLWLTLHFMNQDAEPLMRLYSVTLDENDKLVYTKVEDKVPPPEPEKPASPPPEESTEPADSAKPSAAPEPASEGATEESTNDEA